MATQKYYVGDIGTQVLVETGNDLSTASLVALKVRRPDETEVTWTAAMNPLVATEIEYITVAGDFAQAGVHKIQAYVEFPGGKVWRGNTASFTISDVFE